VAIVPRSVDGLVMTMVVIASSVTSIAPGVGG